MPSPESRSATGSTRDGAGLYVHVPFCSAVCPYCDFAVTVGDARERIDFVEAVLLETGICAAEADSWRFDTLYLGGGTPSALEPELLDRLLVALEQSWPGLRGAQWSLEANPEDVSVESCALWRERGFQTISLGVQSFDAATLRFLGRRHSAEQARQAVATALSSGFGVVSLDLIFGVPEAVDPEGAGLWESVESAIALGTSHLSCYQLTVHEGTPFARREASGRLRQLEGDAQGALLRRLHERLSVAGLEAYEVSNFARSAEHRSAHNLKYWTHRPYLGLGPSAHSFDGRRRWWNESRLPEYRRLVGAGSRPVVGEESLSDSQLALEVVMLGLRTVDGIDLGAFRERFGVDLLARNRVLVEGCLAEGLLRVEGVRLVPTRVGLSVADGLASRFDVGAGTG